jgi:CheY-like chemotaxis protein
MHSPRGCAKCVLLVDDNALLRDTFAFLLKSWGYAVQEASDGQDALDRLKAGLRPDCILLDLSMPGMDGWQFRAQQCQNPAWASIPLVIVSGERGIEESARSLGAAGYLEKPADPETLARTLRTVCSAHQVSAPSGQLTTPKRNPVASRC